LYYICVVLDMVRFMTHRSALRFNSHHHVTLAKDLEREGRWKFGDDCAGRKMVMIMSVYDHLFCRLELDFVMQET
jgi:hypothetical protein